LVFIFEPGLNFYKRQSHKLPDTYQGSDDTIEQLNHILGFQGDYNEDTLIPNPMGTTGPAGTESAKGQVMAEDTYAEGWVLTNPNSPLPANTMALPVVPPAATTAAIPQQQTTSNHGKSRESECPPRYYQNFWDQASASSAQIGSIKYRTRHNK
jgi:hypothetical protein